MTGVEHVKGYVLKIIFSTLQTLVSGRELVCIYECLGTIMATVPELLASQTDSSLATTVQDSALPPAGGTSANLARGKLSGTVDLLLGREGVLELFRLECINQVLGEELHEVVGRDLRCSPLGWPAGLNIDGFFEATDYLRRGAILADKVSRSYFLTNMVYFSLNIIAAAQTLDLFRRLGRSGLI